MNIISLNHLITKQSSVDFNDFKMKQMNNIYIIIYNLFLINTSFIKINVLIKITK